MTDIRTKAKAIMEAYYDVDTTEEEGIIALLREVVNQLQYYQCCEDEGVEDMVLDARAILDVADELEAL
jgi:hypothetical protein